MATNHELYQDGLLGLADGDIDWNGAANFAAVLLTATYTPDLSTHSTYADLTNEVTDADYSAQAITARDITLDAGDVQYAGSDVVFGSDVTIEAAYMAFVQGDPEALGATDRLVSLHTLSDGDNVSSTNSEFRVNAPANGWFRLSEA